MKAQSWLLLTAAVGIGIALPLMSQKQDASKEAKRTTFLPPPLTDDWTKWIVGEWEGAGESDTGKGTGTARIELALSGQFLIHMDNERPSRSQDRMTRSAVTLLFQGGRDWRAPRHRSASRSAAG